MTTYRYSAKLNSSHYDFNKDSLSLVLGLYPRERNFWLPFLIFRSDKSKMCIRYSLHGKGLSSREYTITYSGIRITADDSLVGRSKDPDLFKEQIRRQIPTDAVSPLYGTNYLLAIKDAPKKNIKVQLEFSLRSKAGVSEDMRLDMPLENIPNKSFKFMNFTKP